MKLLALDQASKTSGYSIWEDGKLLAHGSFTFNDRDMGKRLYKIRKKVKEFVEDNNITEVIIEDVQLQKGIGENVKTFKVLAEVFGVIYELLTEMNIPNSSVLASVWKSTVGIKGSRREEQKRNAIVHVKEVYGIAATSDEADAICIGEYYFASKKQDSGYDWS